MNQVFFYDVNADDPNLLSHLKKVVIDILDTTKLNVNGKSVLVKPNMLGAFEPSRGATTNPILIEAIVEVLEEMHAAEIYVGDSPGGAEKGIIATAKKCGLYEASKGHFYNFSLDATMIPVQSRFVNQLSVPKKLLEADIVINVPKLKTHGFMGFSACIKNMFGIVIGPYKAKMHFKAPSVTQFGELLVDIYQIREPDLNIVEALTVMEGDGPTSGPVRTENLIIASLNGASADTAIADMLSFDKDQIKYLSIASKRNIGVTELSQIDIIGPFRKLNELIKPVTYQPVSDEEGKRAPGKLNSGGLSVLHEISRMVPNLTRAKDCIRCGICADNCPAKAIVVEDLPKISYEKCISCYCCAELCHKNCYDIWDVKDRMERVFEQFTQ